METDSVPKKDHILHYSKVDIISIQPDDEEQSKLTKKKEV